VKYTDYTSGSQIVLRGSQVIYGTISDNSVLNKLLFVENEMRRTASRQKERSMS